MGAAGPCRLWLVRVARTSTRSATPPRCTRTAGGHAAAVRAVVAGISAQAPDPFIANSDPCCGHPDTCGEVAGGAWWALALVLLDALLACMAVALVSWAATRRCPRLRRLALLPGGATLAAVLVLAAVIVPQLARTSAQVRRLLGPPTGRGRTVERKTYWDDGRLIVYFARGRVAQATAAG